MFIERKLRADKLGILYLSAILKEHGHSIYLVQDEIESADALIHMWKPHFVAYSITSDEYPWFTALNKRLKKKHRFTCVVGGPHFTYFHEQGTRDPDINFVVQGPGEYAMLDIVEGRASEKLVVGHIPEVIDAVPHPDRSILYRYPEFGNARMKRFIAGRDCRNACIYCFNHLYHKLYSGEKHLFFQMTSPGRMVDEISEVYRRWGLELIYFNDDDLAQNIQWLDEFLEIYHRMIDLPFCGSVRAENATTEVLTKMSDAGCTFLNIALESAVPETLKILRRGSMKRSDVVRCVQDCQRLGIQVRLQNMIGLPVEDPLLDALKTLEFNKELSPTDSWAAIFQPFPKTDAWKLCLEKGLISAETESSPFFEDCILHFTDADKITHLGKWWYFIVKYGLPMDMVQILMKIPLPEQQKRQLREFRWRESSRILYRM